MLADFILISDRQGEKDLSGKFRRARRKTPLGWRQARMTTMLCGIQRQRLSSGLFDISITWSDVRRVVGATGKPPQSAYDLSKYKK